MKIIKRCNVIKEVKDYSPVGCEFAILIEDRGSRAVSGCIWAL